MTSIASWQVAHPALNTSIFRLAAICLVPSLSALPGLNGSRWQRDGRRYPLEVPPRSSVELRGLETRHRRRQVSPSPGCLSAMSAFSQQLASTCMPGARTAPPYFGHSAMGAARGGVNAMNPALSPARERAATLAFDKQFDEQAAPVRLETWQNPTERKPPAKGTATSL